MISSTVLQGCNVDELPEDRTKVALIAKARFLTDVENGLIRTCQQLLSSPDSKIVHIGNKGLPRNLFEEAPEVRRAHSHCPGGVVDGNNLRAMILEQLECWPQPLNGVLPSSKRFTTAVIIRVIVYEREQDHL